MQMGTAMRLRRIDWIGYRVPFRNRFVAADVSAEYRHGLLLRLEAENGLLGFGESSPVGPGSARAVTGMAAELAALAPALLDSSLAGESPLACALPVLSLSSPPIRFGVETAVLDLLGKARNSPLASLLGGKPGKVPVNALLFSSAPGGIASETREAVEEGFRALKLKVGALPIDEDIERVAAAREAAGGGIAIRVDANQAWSVGEAVEAIARMAPFGIEYVEQPVGAEDLAGLAAVRAAVSTPIAADEAVRSLEDVRRLLETGAADFLIVKAGRTGLFEAVRILGFLRAAGMPAVVTSSLEAGIGLAASLHLAASSGPASLPCGLATAPLLESVLASAPLMPSGGMLQCPDGPGLGTEPEEAALMRYGTSLTGSVAR